MSRPTKRDLPLSENPESARGYGPDPTGAIPLSAVLGRVGESRDPGASARMWFLHRSDVSLTTDELSATTSPVASDLKQR